MRPRTEDMETEQDKPVDREAWRRLLDDDGEPSALTDARIRAAARRALAPRAQRWWLPASLAASLLLAVLIVQWQFGDQPAVVTESDVAATAPAAARARQDAPAARIDDSTAPRNQAAAPAETAPAHVEMKPMNAPPAQVDLPEIEAPVATRESSADELSDAAAAAPPATAVTAAPQEARAERDATRFGKLKKSGELLRSPEAWYAEIEKLRAAGHDEEAHRELENLEAAYPGWLEKHHPADR
jgi:hypothetical protein